MSGTSHPHLESAVACSRCEALNFSGATSCVECGAPLGEQAPPAAEHPAVTAKREASAALRTGYRWIGAVTWLFRLGTGAYGVVTVVAVMALASPDVPVGPGLLVVALSALLTAVMLVGAIQIQFQPVAWTVAVASLATVTTVAHLIGPNPLGLAFLWSAGWAAAFWAAVVPMLRFRRVMEEHMDLYITHHASHRTVRSVAGRSPMERHERLLSAMHRASRRAWTVSAVAAAAICLASTFGAYAYANERPEELSDAIARFEEAWNRSSLTAVDDLFVPGNRAAQSRLLAGMLAGHGWTHVLPHVENGQRRDEKDRLWIDYEAGDMTLSARWVLDGQHWRLVQIDLPRPSHLPALERFLDAWNRSDLEALGTLFRSDTRGEMLDAIEQAMAHRGWKRLPKILEKSSKENEDGEIVLTLRTESGEVFATLAFRTDGKWGLRAIRFPA